MNVNRRSVFGILGGGAVAAPSVAKKIAEDLGGVGLGTQAQSFDTVGGGGGGLLTKAASERDWIPSRIEDLKKQLARKKQTPPRHERSFRFVEAARIDGLRSVSPVNKARMTVEWHEAESEESEKGWIRRELDSLLDRAGLIGLLLK